MKAAIPAPNPRSWYAACTARSAASGEVGIRQQRQQRRLVGDEGGHVLGVRRHEGQRVDGPAAAGEQVDRPGPSSAMRACRSVACMLGGALVGAVLAHAAPDAARVVRDDGAVGEVGGQGVEAAGVHGVTRHEQGGVAGIRRGGRAHLEHEVDVGRLEGPGLRRHAGFLPSSARGPLDEVLGELAASTVGVEADHEAVLVDLHDRSARGVAVGRPPGGHHGVAVDRDRCVVRVVGVRSVPGRGRPRPQPRRRPRRATRRPRRRGRSPARRRGGTGRRRPR